MAVLERPVCGVCRYARMREQSQWPLSQVGMSRNREGSIPFADDFSTGISQPDSLPMFPPGETTGTSFSER